MKRYFRRTLANGGLFTASSTTLDPSLYMQEELKASSLSDGAGYRAALAVPPFSPPG